MHGSSAPACLASVSAAGEANGFTTVFALCRKVHASDNKGMQATDTHEHYRQAESCRFGSASVSEDNHLLLQLCNLHWVKRKLLSGSGQRKHDVVQRSVANCLLAPRRNVTI